MRLAALVRPLILVAAATAVSAAQPPAGFTALFNGKDLSGWRGGDTFDHRELLAMSPEARAAKIADWTKSLTELKDGKPHWRAEGGVLVNDGQGRYATTEQDYGDFELLLDYKLEPGADSGVYLRGVPQVQIWDYTMPDPKGHGYAKGSGGLWNNGPMGAPGRDPLVRTDKPIGQWNSLRVVMVGSRVSVWLNQKLVVDHQILENYYDRGNKKLKPDERRPVPPKGPIELQTHGGGTQWRNIFLRKIGGEEANKILASKGGQGFKPIFNGKDLSGWTGATDAVEVKDGVIMWKEKKGGVPYWNKELKDFQARVMFKLPKAGNNGLAIRYPGAPNTGDVAYIGMCELQILDDNYEQNKPAKIEPQQAHGSAYGMVAAARGYQRPIGEWNFQEVTVKGSTLKVELNGSVILDTDLKNATINPKVLKHEQTGRTRLSGYFGFAGHNDPVQFKEISIKEL